MKTSDEAEIETALAVLRAHANNEVIAAHIFDKTLDLIQQYHASLFWGDRMLSLDKAVAFRSDPAFQQAVSGTSSSTGANQYASPDGITWRFNTLIWAARQALTVAGDLVECGVYEGDMSWVLTEMVDLPRAGRRLHLFDTFSGFSPMYSSEEDYPDAPEFFKAADRDYKRSEIYGNVQRRFAAKSYVIIHRGTVPDSLDDAPEAISFLHLDMNSPGPERAALTVLYDRISPGGLIVLDDYGWSIFKKQKEAADEFIAAKGHAILELPTGQGLAIKPR